MFLRDMPNLSIKQKVTLALILFVLLTASLVGALSQWSARSIIEDRMLNQELPNTIKPVSYTHLTLPTIYSV